MPLEIGNYVRKPFAVQAVEVTADNIHEVAEWCQGEIKQEDPAEGVFGPSKEYIRVEVKRAMNERQSRAYYGDWVLSASQGPAGFKVYTPKAFLGSFERQVDHMINTVQRMNDRAEKEEVAEAQEETLEYTEELPPVRRDPLKPFIDQT